jgi:hypothetical protein
LRKQNFSQPDKPKDAPAKKPVSPPQPHMPPPQPMKPFPNPKAGFACRVCGKIFKGEDELAVHMEIAHQNRENTQ